MWIPRRQLLDTPNPGDTLFIVEDRWFIQQLRKTVMSSETHGLGDGPIQSEYRATMQAIAEALDKILNGDAKGNARQTGFVLLVFPFGTGGRCNYISNGADRRDIVALMKHQIARFEGQPDVEGTA